MSQWAVCFPAWRFLYHVIVNCKGPINRIYKVTKRSNQEAVIAHQRDRAPIKKGERRTNHNREFCYRYDNNNDDHGNDDDDDDNHVPDYNYDYYY